MESSEIEATVGPILISVGGITTTDFSPEGSTAPAIIATSVISTTPLITRTHIVISRFFPLSTTTAVNAATARDVNSSPKALAAGANPSSIKGTDAEGRTIEVPAFVTTTSEITTSTDSHLTTVALTTVIRNPAALPATSFNTHAASKSPGVIIGGVIGGVLCLISLLIILGFLRYRCKSRERLSLLGEEDGTGVVTDTRRFTPGSSLPTTEPEMSPSVEVIEGATAVKPFRFPDIRASSPLVTIPPVLKKNPMPQPPSQQSREPLNKPGRASTEMRDRVIAVLSSPRGANLRAGEDDPYHVGDRVDEHATSNGEMPPESLPVSGEASSLQNIDLLAARVAEILNAQGRTMAEVQRPPNILRLGDELGTRHGATGISRSVSDGGSTASTAPPMYEE